MFALLSLRAPSSQLPLLPAIYVWVYDLPFVGLWFALCGFEVCLLWVWGLPFVGSGSSFCGFGVCLLWVYDLPLLGLRSASSGFMVYLLWVYGLRLRVHGLPFVGLWSASSGSASSGLFWVHGLPLLASSGFMVCLFQGSQKASRRLPEASQKVPRKFPEGLKKDSRRLPEGFQKASRRLWVRGFRNLPEGSGFGVLEISQKAVGSGF